jgi:hypothetical protein
LVLFDVVKTVTFIVVLKSDGLELYKIGQHVMGIFRGKEPKQYAIKKQYKANWQ